MKRLECTYKPGGIAVAQIVRVSDEKAADLVKRWPKEYRYVPKSAWKAQEAAKKAEG